MKFEIERKNSMERKKKRIERKKERKMEINLRDVIR